MRFSPTQSNRHHRRKGAVLLVVLAMLALFAVIGLSFVFYAESRATSARIFREAQGANAATDAPDANAAALGAFSQLIYDTTDGPTGVYSSIRGHGLARAMYGAYYEGNNPAAPQTNLQTNAAPYNGMGAPPTHVVNGIPIVNYAWTAGMPNVVDPERTLPRPAPDQLLNANTRYIGKNEPVTYPTANDLAMAMVNATNGNVLVPSFHRPWIFNSTVANSPNEFLRQMALSTTGVATSGDGSGDDWTNANGRYRILRPRPFDHRFLSGPRAGQSDFPYPPKNSDNTVTGDVQNLKGAAYPFLNPDGSIRVDAAGNPILISKNDSVWIDTGATVQIWNGKRVKPLFAFLVVPTNGKVNVNASGNMRGLTENLTAVGAGEPKHDSSHGFNASEINPSYVMRNSTAKVREVERMIFNKYNSTINQPAYNPANPVAVGAALPNPQGYTQTSTLFKATFPPNAYAPLDWDGGAPVNAMRMQLPGQQGTFGPTSAGPNQDPQVLGNSAFALAPRWAAPKKTTGLQTGYNRYGNGDIGDVAPVESKENPYLWNPYLWKSSGTLGRVYSESDMRKLHTKWADDDGITNDTQPGYLSPINFGALRGIAGLSTSPNRSPANAARFNITTRSNSLAIHNVMPLMPILPVTPGQTYALMPGLPAPTVATGVTIPDPASGIYGVAGSTGTDFQRSTLVPAQVLLRGAFGNLPPLDLNRPLADYRHALARKYGLELRPDNVISPTAANYAAWVTNNAVTTTATPADTTLVAGTAAQPTPEYSLVQAMTDRQDFAKDIYARLVIATGASAIFNPATGYFTPQTAPGTPEFDALRYLAQLAVNIVDYIDGDDVSTTFVWNPDPATLALPALSFFGDPRNTSLIQAPNRLVLGVEKPKLVINEAYSELTNNIRDSLSNSNRATQPLELRFILELMNPNTNDLLLGNESKPFAGVKVNPMSNATLYYSVAQQTQVGATPPVPYSSYVIDLHKDGVNALSTFGVNGNVLATPAIPPESRVDFVAIATDSTAAIPKVGYAGATARTAAAPNPPSPQVVGPVGTRYNPIPTANPINQGYLVLAPAEVPQNTNGEYAPVPWVAGMTNAYTVTPGTPSEYLTMVAPHPQVGLPSSTLQIDLVNPPPRENQVNPDYLDPMRATPPAVVVRRLANPYLPPNDPSMPGYPIAGLPINPYVAIDKMQNIFINDGLRVAQNSNVSVTNPTPQRPNTFPPKIYNRHATIKAHPFASTPNMTQQINMPSINNTSTTPHESFFRHNGQTTTDPEAPTTNDAFVTRTQVAAGSYPQLLLSPQGGGTRTGFDWMVFMDRPLVNQLDLLHVPAVPPHMLTERFVQGDMSNLITQPYSYLTQQHTATWNNNLTRLHRALEYLQVKPWSYATPIAGRVPGKININYVNDPNVLLALADPQSGDFFSAVAGTVDTASGLTFDGITDAAMNYPLTGPALPISTNSTFGRLQTVRGGGTLPIPAPPTPGTPPALTSAQYDPATNTLRTLQVPSAVDKPFKTLGNAWTAGGYIPVPKNGVRETVLNGVFDLPSQNHPYVKNSLTRKIFNNVTTTSETFEVFMTVGFFEVLNSGPYYATTGPANTWVTPQLGKEVFKDVPGDLRTRFYAVIDRSNLAIDPTSIVPGSTPKQGKKPAITELASTLPPSLVAGNVLIDIQATGFVGGTAGTPATTINNPAALTLQYDMSPTETTPFVITAGTVLRIGFGSTEELVTVNAVNAFDTLTGTGRLTVVRAVSPNTHAVGTRVMNGETSLGNPGPQPAFDPSQPNYQAVMPYMQKLDD